VPVSVTNDGYNCECDNCECRGGGGWSGWGRLGSIFG